MGGNWEFSSVLAIDSDYTRSNQAGFDHARIADDFVPEAFCRGVPHGVDLASFRTRAWQATGRVGDRDVIDLGGRRLEVLHVPGHTPDAVALLDRENRLLFTGDTWYDASLWLFARETSLEDYAASIRRLADLEAEVDFLLGGHNSARVEAGRLKGVARALGKLRSGEAVGDRDDYGRLVFEIDGVRILTSRQALDGQRGDTAKGGSGLDTWR